MATIQVTTTADSGVGSLRDAIARAQSGDEIRFSLASGAKITLTSGELTIPEAKDLTINGTGVTNLTISGNNASRIFNIKSTASTVNQLTLKNLILSDGFATPEPPESDGTPADTGQRGGAILSGSTSTLTLDNVTFNDNKAIRGGGAIYSTSYSKLIVLNSKFNRNNGQGNNQERAGGAITFRGPDEIIVKNSEFIDNKGVNGGAINVVHGQLTIDNSRFINNTSDGVFDPSQPADAGATPETDARRIRGYGGAVYVDSAHESTLEDTGYIRIYGSVFEGNQGKGAGGAAYLYTIPGDKVIIDSSSFKNNQVRALTSNAQLPTGYVLAPGNGGAVNQTSNADIGANAGFSVTNSTFANNTATGQGGGLWKNVSPTSIVNSTFFGNRVENLENSTDSTEIGGGVMLYGQATVTNTTFANNFANWMGGGLAADTDTGVNVSNTIFFNNIGNRGGATQKVGSQTNRLMANGQNNIQFPNRTTASTDFLAVTGIQVIDPKLGPLQDNGGPTKTMGLLSGSPAIDTGANIANLNRDQRGRSRPADGDGNGTATRDIGAFEVSTSTQTPEIEAVIGGVAIIDGTITHYDYGQTPVGVPVNKNLIISNTGTGTLSLDGLQFPKGFSVVGSLPASIAPGVQAGLTIQLTASKSGQYEGEVLFATNDSDESPFSFAIKGSVIGVINGTAGGDILRGVATDERINSLDGNDTIQGNAGNDTISAGNGNDVIAGGVGLNSLVGGAGNDSYTLNNPLDIIVESSSSTSEIDIANIAADFTLPTNVESLGLLGTNNYQGTGNSLKNLITGNPGNNTLRGEQGNDNLRGLGGNDSLVGGDGNDILESGTGIDTLNGGLGNDNYVVLNNSNLIIETSTLSTEIDRVESAANYTLQNNIEFLTLTGAVAITGTGNQQNNWIVGNALNNSLNGLQGNDTLDGGAGQNTLDGGIGNDSYVISSDTDLIIETSTLSTERDGVRASVEYTLGSGNVENLSLIGTAKKGTGNHLNNTIIGNEFDNDLVGGAGNDTIIDPSTNNDTLSGGAGNDNLNPGVGNDSMEGGTGNDIYQVDSPGDIINEESTITTDLDNVISSVSYSLGSDLDLLTLTGTGNLNGSGNELSNNITGNDGINNLNGGAGNDRINGGAGNDTLTGGTGNDTLTGGTGNDSFYFSSPSERRDSITDFNISTDLIRVATSGFGGGVIPSGPLFTSRLAIGTLPTAAIAQFIYNPATGNLLFDRDGTGAALPDHFLTLANKALLTSSKIVIVNDTTALFYSVIGNTLSLSEGAAPNTTPITFVISRTGNTTGASSIQYNLGGSTAVAQFDYQVVGIIGEGISSSNGTINFEPNATQATLTVNVLGDSTREPNETINVNILNPAPPEANIAIGSATTTIINDDPIPAISTADVAIAEPETGSTNATFTLTLSNRTSSTVTVNFATQSGTATAGTDYTTVSGTVTFAPNQLSSTIQVPILGDSNPEPQETFKLNLSSATNATLSTTSVAGFILNGQNLPSDYSISANNLSISEGAAPNTVLTSFVISRTNEITPSSINYGLSGIATELVDYQVFGVTGDGITTAAKTINFAAGAKLATLTLQVFGDSAYELNEDINVTLANPNPASGTISKPSAITVIRNDDPIPSITGSNLTFPEGNIGRSSATFLATLTRASYQTVTVNYATADGTAIAESDYAATSGSLTFAPGQTVRSLSVRIIGDTNIEPQETFKVNFSNPLNATLGTTFVTGFINNDDNAGTIDYSIAANTPSITEGAAPNTRTITFFISRNNFTGNTSSVRYGFSKSVAAENVDFKVVGVTGTGITQGGGRITFATSAKLATLTLQVLGDSTYELNEALTVSLSSPDTSGSTISTPDATTIIINDEPLPTVKVNPITLTEGSTGGTTNANFVVYLNYASPQALTVDFATANGTATAGSDYTGTSGTLTFSPGQLSKTVAVSIASETLYEANENFTFNLSNAINATVGTSSVLGTITNDDLTLVGGSGADVLVAGSENNTLIGNGGADTLTGGPGNDRYVYNAMGDGGDTITDFRVGQDKINLTTLMASLGYTGSNPITDGYVKFVATTSLGVSATRIEIDPDGSGGPTTAVPYILCQKVHILDMSSGSNFVF